eukprot:gene21815-biopygen7599
MPKSNNEQKLFYSGLWTRVPSYLSPNPERVYDMYRWKAFTSSATDDCIVVLPPDSGELRNHIHLSCWLHGHEAVRRCELYQKSYPGQAYKSSTKPLTRGFVQLADAGPRYNFFRVGPPPVTQSHSHDPFEIGV